MSEPIELHPRPQLARSSWMDLNGEWDFAIDQDNEGIREHWERGENHFPLRITVPFPPESPASGIGNPSVETIWYRTRVALDRPARGRRALLHFEGVDYRCDVWVNGQHVIRHEGGSVGFHADITDTLNDSAPQILVVRAYDSIRSLEQPRGKQDWEAEPHIIWYQRTTGIWRDVWVEDVATTHLTSLAWSTRSDGRSVHVEARIDAHRQGDSLDIDLSIDGSLLARVSHHIIDGVVRAELVLNDRRLTSEPERLQWSPENPSLIHATVRVTRQTETLDEVFSYLGLRTVGIDERAFLLNGRPYFLRMVLEQAYWPDTHLASPNAQALRHEVELIKELGFNGIRMHQVVADPRMLYWCDRLGLLVWADAAASYEFTSISFTRTVKEWTEIIERDASHPSIVAWVPFNESWGVPNLEGDPKQRHAVQAVTHMLRALDPTRLVLGNDGWEHVGGDIIGIHDYSRAGDELRERYGTESALAALTDRGRVGGRRAVLETHETHRVPVVLTEFGGISLTLHDSAWEGYGHAEDTDTFLQTLGEQLSAAQGGPLAGFCYTQLTDTAQEQNGLLTETRHSKLPTASIYRLVTGQDTRGAALE